jgi:DNA topoisomerase VI subunit B
MSATAKLKRETFKTSRLLDFCSEKELTAQVGHDASKWLLVILKELVDNALDACEEAGTPPSINVEVDAGSVIVEDNGPGMPVKTIKGVLDYAVRVSSREAYVSPTRGAQGNALKTVIAMPYVLSGEKQQGKVEISAKGKLHQIIFGVDRIRQEPKITHKAIPAKNVKNGTFVKVYLAGLKAQKAANFTEWRPRHDGTKKRQRGD